jgi:hypothetical protein
VSRYDASRLLKQLSYGGGSGWVGRPSHLRLCERFLQTNIPFLLNVLSHPDFTSGHVTTRFLERNPELTQCVLSLS